MIYIKYHISFYLTFFNIPKTLSNLFYKRKKSTKMMKRFDKKIETLVNKNVKYLSCVPFMQNFTAIFLYRHSSEFPDRASFFVYLLKKLPDIFISQSLTCYYNNLYFLILTRCWQTCKKNFAYRNYDDYYVTSRVML